MKNSAYWQKRFEILEEALGKYGEETYRGVQPYFDKALREINADIETWIYRIAKNNEVSMANAKKLLDANQLEEFKWTVEEYIKYGKENAINQQWVKQLENASAKFHISRLEALKIQVQQSAEKAFGNYLDDVDTMARKVYEEGYYRSAFELQRGFGAGWNIASIDEKKLSKLISKPWAADGKNFSDRIWQAKNQMVYDLHSELTRACILGKGPDEAIKNLSKYVDKRFKNAKVQAGRLVMTEQAFFSAAAQKDAFNELGVEEYEIVATLDSHTSEICQQLDGKHFPMSQYEPGVTAPPFHVWCRSTTCPYFDDEFTVGELRAARGEDGKTYQVPADMTYPEWRAAIDSEDFSSLLTGNEKEAIVRYLGGESYTLNDSLRREAKLSKDQRQWIDTLNSALSKTPSYEGLVCRSISILSSGIKGFLNQYKVGGSISYKAFSSAEKFSEHSMYYNPDANVQIFIKSKTGKDISSFNPGENEVLYPTGSEFIVKEVEQHGDKYFILLEEKT